jgi:putative hydrolase of the HAD superfamily
MALREPKVLTFDVVGTLIDFEAGILGFLRQYITQTRAFSDDQLLSAYRVARATKPSQRFPDHLVRVYDQMALQLGLPRERTLGEAFRDSIRAWPAFADSRTALQRLKVRFGLVAMTNAQRWSFGYLSANLGDPFADSVTVDEAACEKPDPCFFAFTRGRLSRDGYGLDDVLHVAQSQYHDIGVARSLGYTVCWIERRKGMPGFGGTQEVAELTKPDYHFGTLADLADAADAGQLRIVER